LLLAKGNARASHNGLALLTLLLVDDLPTFIRGYGENNPDI
jgi:hypothetical protein